MVRDRKKADYILIVDDDEVTSYLHHLIIEHTGVGDTILRARNGEEALEIIKKICSGQNSNVEDCDAIFVFLDINMPVMDGFAFLQKFEETNVQARENIHIIIVTTSNNNKDIEKAREFEIDGYVTKPLTEEKIEDIFKRLF